ncbi:uncharacterized protein [Spinacia oleracea]|uniref:Reverse transcriptase zinc-binding domain-containing protein n=1 Tax=Spinacia oleracea TaxID=3562 RepID=A0ABM3R841_SPIOL|nr:uncharacterized protein LOC130467321 [Spinacia oleracea]
MFSPNTPEAVKSELKNTLGTPCSDTLGTYLGCNVDIDGRSSRSMHYLVAKVQKKVLSWKYLCLSQAGRLLLINAILAAFCANVLAVFLIPKNITKQIDAILMHYWWKGVPNEKGICWVRRTKLEIPKGMGGIGLRNVESFNNALLVKQAFRIHNNPSLLLSKVMTSAYKRSPVEAAMTNNIHQKSSWGYRGLCMCVQKAKKGIGMTVIRGNTPINQDNWLPSRKVEFRNTSQSDYGGLNNVKDLFKGATREWNENLIWRTFKADTAREILSLHIPQEDTDDTYQWIANKKGQASVKSVYSLLVSEKEEQMANGFQNQFWKLLWKSNLLPKWKIFVWKLSNKALSVKENLKIRGMGLNTQCVLCLNHEEDSSHIFRDCFVAAHVWKASSLGITALNNRHIGVEEWTRNFLMYFWKEDGHDSSRAICFVAYLWSIWKQRNEVIFRGQHVNPEQIIQMANIYVREAITATCFRKSLFSTNTRRNVNSSQSHPFCVLRGVCSNDYVMLFADGVWKWNKMKGYSVAGMGYILCDDGREIIKEATGINATCAIQAKLKAVLMGVQRVSVAAVGVSLKRVAGTLMWLPITGRSVLSMWKAYETCSSQNIHDELNYTKLSVIDFHLSTR